jgi:mannose-6-phosphate isomerase-like protein (cupin superfamily)
MMSLPRKINLETAGTQIVKPWTPVVLGDINDSQVKLAKFDGTFDWHSHPNEDEGFLVVSGKIVIAFRGGNVELKAGEFLVVPRGVEHRPQALTSMPVVLMFEPSTTLNTGDKITERTVATLERI